MGVTDAGLEYLGERIAGTSTETIGYLGFASGSIDFVGTETTLTGEFLRKAVTWSKTGIYQTYTVEVASTEGTGSNLNSVGLNTNATIGSGTLFSYDTSFIGSKNDTFNVQVEGEVFYKRPE